MELTDITYRTAIKESSRYLAVAQAMKSSGFFEELEIALDEPLSIEDKRTLVTTIFIQVDRSGPVPSTSLIDEVKEAFDALLEIAPSSPIPINDRIQRFIEVQCGITMTTDDLGDLSTQQLYKILKTVRGAEESYKKHVKPPE